MPSTSVITLRWMLRAHRNTAEGPECSPPAPMREGSFAALLQALREVWPCLRQHQRIWVLDPLEIASEQEEMWGQAMLRAVQPKGSDPSNPSNPSNPSDPDARLGLGNDTVFFQEHVNAVLTIGLHPTYRIPCAYLQSAVPDRLLQPHILAQLFPHLPVLPTDCADHRTYLFGCLLPDVHPITQSPCLTLHPCDLTERLACICETDALDELCEQDAGRVAVAWVSIVGPFIGLAVPPHLSQVSAIPP